MKLLVFSDLHCDARAAQRVVEMADNVDVVVGAGDFATVRRQLSVTIDVLRQLTKPAILVPGNSETLEELVTACADWPTSHVLHGNGIEIDGVAFYGLGGAVPVTPFGAWSYDFTEDAARQLLANCPSGAVLVTHSPPNGIVDRSSSGKHLGSVAVREVIERTQPRLVVCGHIHESGGQSAWLSNVPVINAGPDGVLHALSR